MQQWVRDVLQNKVEFLIADDKIQEKTSNTAEHQANKDEL